MNDHNWKIEENIIGCIDSYGIEYVVIMCTICNQKFI